MAKPRSHQRADQPAGTDRQAVVQRFACAQSFQHRAGKQQEPQPQTGHPALIACLAAEAAGVAVEPGNRGAQQPPRGKAEQIIKNVGQIGAEQAGGIVDVALLGHAARPRRIQHIEAGQQQHQVNRSHRHHKPAHIRPQPPDLRIVDRQRGADKGGLGGFNGLGRRFGFRAGGLGILSAHKRLNRKTDAVFCFRQPETL